MKTNIWFRCKCGVGKVLHHPSKEEFKMTRKEFNIEHGKHKEVRK